VALVWKLLHLITVLALVGGLIGRNVTFRMAQRSQDLSALAALLSASLALEQWLVIPGSMLVLLTGGVAAWTGNWQFRAAGQPTWLLVASIVYLSLIPVIAVVLAPRRAKRTAALAEAVTANRITSDLTASLNDPAVKWARIYEALVVAVVLVLMVLKPF
jgi:uncharacterized membrane protein